MTVKELIDFLSKMPQDARVRAGNACCGYHPIDPEEIKFMDVSNIVYIGIDDWS